MTSASGLKPRPQSNLKHSVLRQCGNVTALGPMTARACNETLYDVLGVARSCTAAELSAAYRVLTRARRSAPDEGAADAKTVDTAYEVLSHPPSRAAYDFLLLEVEAARAPSALRRRQLAETQRLAPRPTPPASRSRPTSGLRLVALTLSLLAALLAASVRVRPAYSEGAGHKSATLPSSPAHADQASDPAAPTPKAGLRPRHLGHDHARRSLRHRL
jgi:hypothetical protein